MQKSPDAFRTISEVAEDLDLPQHVLRFWETRFPQIRPLKRAGGRRYYRPADILLLRSIRQALYDEGYTIKGVQRLLKEQGPKMLRTGDRVAIDPAQADSDRQVVDGQVVDGQVVDGQVVDGPLVDGPLVDDPLVDASDHDLAPLGPVDPGAVTVPLGPGTEDYVLACGDVTGGDAQAPARDTEPDRRVAGRPGDDRADLREALSIIEDCLEMLRAARLPPP